MAIEVILRLMLPSSNRNSFHIFLLKANISFILSLELLSNVSFKKARTKLLFLKLSKQKSFYFILERFDHNLQSFYNKKKNLAAIKVISTSKRKIDLYLHKYCNLNPLYTYLVNSIPHVNKMKSIIIPDTGNRYSKVYDFCTFIL